MLLTCDRHTEADYDQWEKWEEVDAINSKTNGYIYRLNKTLKLLREFIDRNREDTYYVGVSWGKDSVVLAHMIYMLEARPNNIYIRQLDNENPYSANVRNSFLDKYPLVYEELMYTYQESTPEWFKHGKPNRWFQILNELNQKYDKRITGLRKDESAKRKFRFIVYGIESHRSFTPFVNFTVEDIFAYLYENTLPVHPNYAMTGGGRWDRNRIRVASLGNKEGDGIGRREWEKEYYADILRRMECMQHTKS